MPASRSVVSMLLRELGDFLYTLKRRPEDGRAAAVLGRRTPDGGRARIATPAGCTTSPASGRTSLDVSAGWASRSGSVIALEPSVWVWTACRKTRGQ